MTTSQGPANPMADALARLWARFLPEIEQRVALVEAAAAALQAGTLTFTLREEAHSAAHKLAGTLGTFGLHRGTDLARRAELAFGGETPDALEQGASPQELAAWVAELRALIESRQ